MVHVNEHYLKLRSGYLFPEIARRVEQFLSRKPEAAHRLIRCGIGDVTEPLAPVVVEAMKSAADELAHRETFRGYPPPTGYPFLREAIAKHDFTNRGLDISPDEVFVSDGSKGDCGAVLDILGHGNRIGIADPVYPVYVDTNVMAGNTGEACGDAGYQGITYFPCTAENGFVAQVPNNALDVIYLCYPNNPTGSMITRDQLTEWVRFAREHKSIILYDVAYQAYITDRNVPRSIFEIDGAKECAMEFHSFSKNGGFTGVRCGYTVCPKELTGATKDGMKIPLCDLWYRRWSTKSNGVNYTVQRAAEAIYSSEGQLQVQERIDYYLTNAKILREGCENIGLTVFGGVNAPYVWVTCPDGLSSWKMFDRLLEDANIVITPGSGFGECGEGYFRISAFNSRENAEEAVDRLKTISILNKGKKAGASA